MKTFISSQKIFTVFFPVIIMVFLISNTAWGLRPSIGNTKNISQTIHKNVRQALKPTFNIQSRYAGEMTGIAVSRNANLMASASKNGAAQLWDMNTGQRIKDFRKGSSPVLSLDFVPGGKYLLTGSKNSNIYLWDLNTGRPVQEFQGHGGPVYKIKAMGNGRSFISSGKKGNVHIWDIGQEKPVRNFIKHKDDVLALANSRISRLAVSGGEDEKIYMWDWQTGDLLNTFEESDDITALVLSPDDRYLAAGLDNGSISIWDLNSGKKFYAEKIHNNTVLGMAISPDGRYLASSGINAKGDDNRIIYICSLPDGQKIRWMEGHEDGSCVNDIQFSLNSRYIISAGEDRTARFWDMNSGKELVRMVSMRSGWAVVSPEGYFDGSLEGESEDRLDAIRWTVGERSIAMDGFLENYYRPALLGRLLAGQTVADKGLPFVSEGFVLPPKVGITGPKNNSRILDRRIIVQVESVEENGDIDEIRLFHNEKFIDDSKAKRKKEKNGKRIVKMYPVTLLDGENTFRAVSFNKIRIESEPAEISVNCGASELAPPVLHVVVIGINKYKNSKLNLDYGVPDASAVRDHFAKSYVGIYNGIMKYELFDSNAKKEDIFAKLEELSNVPVQDTVVIYLSGHGDTHQDNWYYIPHDLTEISKNALEDGGISSSMLQLYIARMEARKIFLMIDACKSGGVMDAFSEFDDQRSFALLARASGIHIATAAAKEQNAGELGRLGHGIFTYSLLNALEGKADKNGDGKISVQETLDHIKKEVPEVIQKYNIPAQNPVVNSRGMDFLVAAQPQQ